MRSRLDREISRRLLQEVPTEPTVKNSRIDQLLCRVRAEDVQDDGKVVRAFSYRTAVAAVGAAIMLTTGTYAAVDNYHEHLQSMSQEEQKQLNHMTQAQRKMQITIHASCLPRSRSARNCCRRNIKREHCRRRS
jgi:chromosome condensin MukBEF ATPase and DNA-binding subunit MukB